MDRTGNREIGFLGYVEVGSGYFVEFGNTRLEKLTFLIGKGNAKTFTIKTGNCFYCDLIASDRISVGVVHFLETYIVCKVSGRNFLEGAALLGVGNGQLEDPGAVVGIGMVLEVKTGCEPTAAGKTGAIAGSGRIVVGEVLVISNFGVDVHVVEAASVTQWSANSRRIL